MTDHLNENQLINYIYQLLPDAEREALDLHLSACPSCRASLADHETWQRRIHYSVAGRRRVVPSSRMSYAAIAPRLKRSRRFTMVLKQSNQFVYGALTMALLIAVGVGLYFFVSNLSRPTPTTPEEVKQPTAISTVEVSQPVVNPTAEVSPPPASPVELVLSIKGDPNPLSGPTYATVDPQGNLYVIDANNARIQKFDRNGQFLTMWGRPGTGDGEFSFVSGGTCCGGLAVDGQGQVYVADTRNKRIQKLDSDGQFLAKWDSKGMGDGQFVRPADVAVDGQGYVYVLDDQRGDIQKFDGNGQFLTKWGSLGSGDGQFHQPWGLAVDGEGHIYVADNRNHRIQKFDNQGQFLAKWGTLGTGDGQFLQLNDLAVDEQGNVYVPDTDGSSIQKFDSKGQFLAKWGSFGAGDDQFFQPVGVAVDGEGNIYVVDHSNNRVQKFRQK